MESQDEKHGKMLLHTEHSLLSLLEGEKGIVQKHDFFTELCLHEQDLGKGKIVYNGKRTRRICLVWAESHLYFFTESDLE